VDLLEVKARLSDYRIGRVRRPFDLHPGSGPAYVAKDVNWFVSEVTGRFTSVDDVIYDLSGISSCLSFHPNLFACIRLK